MLLPVTLTTAAACAILTLWLMLRCGRTRIERKILHGDGGDSLMARRMRAQLNFVESAPFVLALIALIELAGKGAVWLPGVAGVFIIGRVFHPFGMDHDESNWMRGAGVGITMLTLLGLSIYAALIAMGVV